MLTNDGWKRLSKIILGKPLYLSRVKGGGEGGDGDGGKRIQRGIQD